MKHTTIFCSLFLLIACSSSQKYKTIEGTGLGTLYAITYASCGEDISKNEIDKILSDFSRSLSVYDSTSLVSQINRNEIDTVDYYFATVFNKAKEIYLLSNGAFDISAEPLFKFWGFSFEKQKSVNQSKIDSLLQISGMDKIELIGNRIYKKKPEVQLNMNAIAKGYAADLVADYLEKKGINNYMIEIGGEIRAKGENENKKDWTVGIDHPKDGNSIPGKDLELVLNITNKAIATSGNYRRFYINEKGEKISHTINPRTGYPVSHSLLSVTVIANDAMTADALATAFMVMGVDSSKVLLEKLTDVDAIFISEKNGQFILEKTKGITPSEFD